MVTHNPSFADIADKVIYVKNGTVEKIVLNEHPKDADDIDC